MNYFALYGSLAYKQVLAVFGCWFIRLNNEFAFPDPELLIVIILYGWSGICSQFGFSVICFMFSSTKSSKCNHFCIALLSCYI